MTSPTHEETSISREVPAVFGEFSTKTGSILYYKDNLWSELIHLGEGILEQVRALEVLSADGEYTALLEAVRLFDDR